MYRTDAQAQQPARRAWLRTGAAGGLLACGWPMKGLAAPAAPTLPSPSSGPPSGPSPGPSPIPPPTPLWHSHFNQGLADWGPLLADWGRHNHRFLTVPGVRGRVLRVHLQAGGIDPASMRARGLQRSGTGFSAPVLRADGRPAPGRGKLRCGARCGLHAATLVYRLRFAAGFEFVRGGKLPGLFGGHAPSGGQRPNGHDGFSLRLMWREQGAGEVYAYLPGSTGQGRSLLRAAWRFEPGQWHTVVQQVQLNAPGHADGWLRQGLDGRWVGSATGLRLRDSATLRVGGVFVDLFHGGNDDSWAPRRDSHVDLAEFSLWAGVGLDAAADPRAAGLPK